MAGSIYSLSSPLEYMKIEFIDEGHTYISPCQRVLLNSKPFRRCKYSTDGHVLHFFSIFFIYLPTIAILDIGILLEINKIT